jgi:hypothetical protein
MPAPEPVHPRVGSIDDHIGAELDEELGSVLASEAEDPWPEVDRHPQQVRA